MESSLYNSLIVWLLKRFGGLPLFWVFLARWHFSPGGSVSRSEIRNLRSWAGGWPLFLRATEECRGGQWASCERQRKRGASPSQEAANLRGDRSSAKFLCRREARARQDSWKLHALTGDNAVRSLSAQRGACQTGCRRVSIPVFLGACE